MTIHTFFSPAKVNLFLKVLKKRDDGYHDIFSVMQPVSLYDEIVLEVEEGKGISVECNNNSVPLDTTNLAYRAAEAFFKATGIHKKLLIKIEKNIPVAAGLGGGSSNAAAVLKTLYETTSPNISVVDLIRIGAGIGSDVPFFILGKSSIATGRGEILKPTELPIFWYILITPPFSISTEWAYKNLDLTKKQEDINITISKVLPVFRTGGLNDPHALQGLLINDLEEVTIKKYPEIKELKKALTDEGAAGSLMSGSGPTVFGIFFEEDRARKAFTQINKSSRFKGMAVFAAQGL